MNPELFIEGLRGVEDRLRLYQRQLEANHDKAARSAANVIRRYIRQEAKAIRGRGTFAGFTKGGKRRSKHLLETDVRIIRRGESWAVRDKAPHAHLVTAGHRMVGHRPDLSFSGQHTTPNPFVHRARVRAANEPLIAARIVLLENGPEVTE